MSEDSKIPWRQCSDLLLACGSVHEPFRFCVKALELIGSVVPYDQAVFLMLDGNRKVTRSHFVGFESRVRSMYLDYYARSPLHGFDLHQDAVELDGRGYVELIDWRKFDWINDDFMTNYIKRRGLSQSLSFTLFDIKGSPATAFSLDRQGDATFSSLEVDIVRLVTAHLNNLYKNMFVRPQGQVRIWDRKIGADVLTAREKEVLDLLCQGVRPAYISRELNISLGTTNKHIAHIYRKFGVDSRQELLVKLLGK